MSAVRVEMEVEVVTVVVIASEFMSSNHSKVPSLYDHCLRYGQCLQSSGRSWAPASHVLSSTSPSWDPVPPARETRSASSAPWKRQAEQVLEVSPANI